MNRTIRRALRRLHLLPRDASGITLVEFGIVAGPLCVLLLGGLDLGYQSYLRSVVQGALNDVARTSSMEAPEFDCTGETVSDQVRCAIATKTDIVARNATYTIVTRNFYEFSGVGRSEKLITDYNNNGEYDEGDCWEDLNENGVYDTDAGREGLGGADDVAFYEVTVTMPRLFPMAGLLGASDEYNITARAALRNQPYSRQRIPPTVCG